MKKQIKIVAAPDAAVLKALDDFVGYTEQEYAEIQRIQRECHVSLAGCHHDVRVVVARKAGAVMNVHTAAKLRNQARRLDRKVHGVASVLAAMRAGAALHLEYRPDERWWLSDGGEVTTKIARPRNRTSRRRQCRRRIVWFHAGADVSLRRNRSVKRKFG